MISRDAETVTGGATESVGVGGGGVAGSKTDAARGETSSKLVVIIGSLGCKVFILRFMSRFAAFCARAIAF